MSKVTRVGRALVVAALLAPLVVPSNASARRPCEVILRAVDAVSKDLVWIGGTGCGGALIERWDGTSWTVSWHGASGTINAIEATGPDDAWAVGEAWSRTLDHYVPLIRHWNGASWTRVAAPWRRDEAWLLDVDVRGDEVWAVGRGPGATPLVIRWTGARFERVATGRTLRRAYDLTGVALPGDSRVWVVGGPDRTFVLTGDRWRIKRLPDLPRGLATVRSVDGGGRLLAVGDTGYLPESGPVTRALATRWNGTRWAVDRLGPVGEFQDVEVVSADRAWAVGCQGGDVGCYSNRPSPLVVRRGAGGAWISSPVSFSGYAGVLTSVDVRGSVGVWVVGWWRDRTSRDHPLVYYREAGAWDRTYPVVFL